jgi:hypothetical protein
MSWGFRAAQTKRFLWVRAMSAAGRPGAGSSVGEVDCRKTERTQQMERFQ